MLNVLAETVNTALDTLGINCDPGRVDCVENFPGLDALRACAVVAGATMTALMARISIFRKHLPMEDEFERNMFYCLLCMGLLFTTQEVLQIGANFIVWRLPLIFFTLWFGWKAVLKRL